VPVRSAADPVIVGELPDGTDGGQGVVLVVDDLVGGLLDVVHSDGVDAGEHLHRGHSAVVGEHLPADVLGDVGEGVQLHEHGCLELSLSALHLVLGDVVAQAHHVVQGVPHGVVQLVVGGHEVHAEQTRVLVAGVEGHEGVGALVGGHVGGVLGGQVLASVAGAVKAAQDGLHHHQGIRIFGGPGCSLEGEGDVSLLQRERKKNNKRTEKLEK
jgi:hypothetical protein